MDVISIGEALIDFTPGKETGSYVRNPGGAPANFAVGVARQGLSAGFVGKLGEDDFGRFLVDTLKENKVEVLTLQPFTHEAITTLAFVTLYEGGERSFTFARRPGADMFLDIQDINEEAIKACKVLHAGSFSLSEEPARSATLHAMKTAKALGKLVSFDVNYRAMVWQNIEEAIQVVKAVLPYVDLLKISEEELAFVGGESSIAQVMKDNDISVVIETLGEKGAKYFVKEATDEVPGLKVKAIDATGAGDAFWAGFISKLLLNGVRSKQDLSIKEVKEALEYGNLAGALCVQKMGGIPALPSKEQMNMVVV